ncbi:hypothetical protein M2277_000437 [Paenibacillus sp. LBL]|nr:hypothetical protein [Paenibacillus sp. LBL]ETT34934.1 hypothetical protein C169_17887 [Paenibacillus sp. FSL R5-808]MDH6669793.1 hypothetical protein [Paenibacillus sp. LBL]
MTPFKNGKKEIRTQFEINLLQQAQAKVPGKPHLPWTYEVIRRDYTNVG